MKPLFKKLQDFTTKPSKGFLGGLTLVFGIILMLACTLFILALAIGIPAWLIQFVVAAVLGKNLDFWVCAAIWILFGLIASAFKNNANA